MSLSDREPSQRLLRRAFPVTPGMWLAFFRRNSGLPGAADAERFGRLLGVSGSTLLRWERDSQRPRAADIGKFVKVCGLGSLQETFLSQSLNERWRPESPSQERLQEAREEAVRLDVPAVVLDELMYPRASNELINALDSADTEAIRSGTHPIVYLMETLESGPRAVSAQSDLRDALVLFWLSTAESCGTEKYTSLVQELTQSTTLRREWLRLANEHSRSVVFPTRLAASLFNRQREFDVLFSEVRLPERHFVLEFQPLTAASQQRLLKLRSKGSSRTSRQG